MDLCEPLCWVFIPRLSCLRLRDHVGIAERRGMLTFVVFTEEKITDYVWLDGQNGCH